MHYAPVFHRKVWIDTWYCIIKKLCCPLQFWWYIAKYVTQTERKCSTVSQCYLCWSSAPWRPYQRATEVAGHFFFQIILVHICSFFAFASLSCLQQSEMGTGKNFYLRFAFFGICGVSLEMRHCALDPAVFSLLLAWTGSPVSTQTYTSVHLDVSVDKIALLVGAVSDRFPLPAVFSQHSSPLPYLPKPCPGTHPESSWEDLTPH